jgi:hypothetical protein
MPQLAPSLKPDFTKLPDGLKGGYDKRLESTFDSLVSFSLLLETRLLED